MVSIVSTGVSHNPLAQKTASSPSKILSSVRQENQDIVAQFLSYQKLTPEQKVRASFLKEIGLTEEALKNLPPDQQKKIEDEIKQRCKDMIKTSMAQKGLLVDMTV